MNNLIQRTITGVLFVAVITGSILFSPALFAVLFAIVTALTLWEFYSLINKSGRASIEKISATGVGLMLYVAIVLLFRRIDAGYVFLIIYAAGFAVIVIAELFREKDALQNWAHVAFGQVYVVIPLALLNALNLKMNVILLALFVILWTYDTGAYVFGMLLGKHRLFERISPKKSWEGAIGGLIVACIAALIIAHFSPLTAHFSSFLSIAIWLSLACVIVVFGTFGDLCESLIKRTLNVKDSGSILPGHGGMLDRFDSLLFASPAVAFYLLTLSFLFL